MRNPFIDWRNKLCLWLARRILPKRLIYWSVIHVWGIASIKDNAVPPAEITIKRALDIYMPEGV